MNTKNPARLHGARITMCATALAAISWSTVHAARTIEQRRPADAQGVVEIVNVAGSIEVEGWDRPEVEVRGTVGDSVERVDVTGTGDRTSIHVVHLVSRSLHWGSDGEAHLIVHMPAKSALMASLVAADLKVTGVQGDAKLQTVSGSLTGEVGGDLRASTVSGDLRLSAPRAKQIELKAISGAIHLTATDAEVDITTVSGTATIDMASMTRGRFKSISGDLIASLALAGDAQLEAESVSGEIRLEFPASPAAEFDVQSISGSIDNCFGSKPTESRYGPGSRLTFKSGEGSARVRIETKSGDVQLCFKGGHRKHDAGLAVARTSTPRRTMPYVM